jgi:hypothetical protein
VISDSLRLVRRYSAKDEDNDYFFRIEAGVILYIIDINLLEDYKYDGMVVIEATLLLVVRPLSGIRVP